MNYPTAVDITIISASAAFVSSNGLKYSTEIAVWKGDRVSFQPRFSRLHDTNDKSLMNARVPRPLLAVFLIR